MSTRYNNGSHYENHPRATELQDGAAHAHTTGELHGKEEHLTPHEQTRRSLEPVEEAFHDHGPSVGHGISAFTHEDIAAAAYQLWEEKGRPHGSAEQDWFEAVTDLRSKAIAPKAAKAGK